MVQQIFTCGIMPINIRDRKCYETVTAEQGCIDESRAEQLQRVSLIFQNCTSCFSSLQLIGVDEAAVKKV